MVQRRSRARADAATGYLERFQLSGCVGAFEITKPRQWHPRRGVPGRHDYCIRQPGPLWLDGGAARLAPSGRACCRNAQTTKSFRQAWLTASLSHPIAISWVSLNLIRGCCDSERFVGKPETTLNEPHG